MKAHGGTETTDDLHRLFEQLRPRLYGWFLKECRGKDQLIEDLMQNTYIKLMRANPPRGYSAGYIFMAARSAWIDYLRKYKPTSEISLEAIESSYHEVDYRFELREPDLRDAIAALPPHLRLVMELNGIYGYNAEEIAKIIGIGYQATKTRIFRARRALRQLLDGSADSDPRV